MSRQTRPTTVVSHAPRFSTAAVSDRLSRSHASWSASSASVNEPSMRYATACSCGRCCSNSSTCQSRVLTCHILPSGSVLPVDEPTERNVTEVAMVAIEVRGLTKTYGGGVEAVKGIDLDVHAGEVFGLLGPNGAGKSTTIGMLTTTLAPTSGSALLGGHDVVEEPLAARRVSSVVFQEAVVDRS